MNIKPILFNTEMVKAIVDKRKTQTRRIAFPGDKLREFRSDNYPNGWWYDGRVFKSFDDFLRYQQSPRCKYKPGDILWVRETWTPFCLNKKSAKGAVLAHSDFCYKASPEGCMDELGCRWFPSIHMPRKAARLFLKVKDVRLERLQKIAPESAAREGTGKLFLDDIAYGNKNYGCGIDDEYGLAKEQFAWLWDSTIRRSDLQTYGWDANPWVWVIEFEPCQKPEGWC